MSQLQDQILNQANAPFTGLMGQPMNMINAPQFPGQIPNPIAQPQNMPLNIGAEDQKNQESN